MSPVQGQGLRVILYHDTWKAWASEVNLHGWMESRESFLWTHLENAGSGEGGALTITMKRIEASQRIDMFGN